MALSSENGCSCRPRIHARTITVNFMSLPSCNVLKVMILSLRILTEQFPYTYIFIYLYVIHIQDGHRDIKLFIKMPEEDCELNCLQMLEVYF